MKIESLTSLRFIAALFVVFSHLGFLASSQSIELKQLYDTVFYEGYIGVTFFFILSGFILSFSYTERMQSNSITNRAFYIARIARIYPLHLLTFLLSLPLVFYGIYTQGGSLFAIVPNFFLIQSFFPDKALFFSANAPSWSLSNELFFYLLFPFFILRKNCLLVVVATLIAVFQVTISLSALSPEQQHYWLYIFPLSRLFDFLVGILLFRLHEAYGQKMRNMGPDLTKGLSIALLMLFIVMKDLIPQAFRYDLYYVLPMALVIFTFAQEGGKISRCLSAKIWVLLGEASFSLYLIHQLVIRYTLGINEKLFGLEGALWETVLMLVMVLGSVLLSIMILLVFEKRATQCTKGFLLNRRVRYS